MTEKLNKKGSAAHRNSQDRCIWMTAGVVSFKLCPLQYDCEHCDFDRAMQLQLQGKDRPAQKTRKRHPSKRKGGSKEIDSFFTFSAGSVPEAFYFHLGHVWVRSRDISQWDMGIDHLLSYILPPPIGLEVYKNEKELIQNEVFGKIVTTVGPLFLSTPLSGTIVSPNPDLAANPHLLQEDPLGRGWLARIRWSGNRSELKAFYSGLEAKTFLSEEARHLRHVLKYQGVEVSKTGQTLADGGNNIRYLHQILSAKSCLELSRVLLALGRADW